MSEDKTTTQLSVTSILEQYGQCLELVSMDPHFENITVGLYLKKDVLTIWTFSHNPGAENRISQIRNQLVNLGGLAPIEDTHNQARFTCGGLHSKPLKFLLMQAVEKDPDYKFPEEMSIKDTKTELTLKMSGRESEGRWVYAISAEGEAPNAELRLRSVRLGFIRYGEMEAVGDTDVGFACGRRHDELVRLLMPYSRNISAVQDMLDSTAMRGQLTTGTAGFSPL